MPWCGIKCYRFVSVAATFLSSTVRTVKGSVNLGSAAYPPWGAQPSRTSPALTAGHGRDQGRGVDGLRPPDAAHDCQGAMPLPTVLILGAGIVGVSIAAHLVRRGQTVVLIDRRPPGRATSAGNAGVISRGSVLPLNAPALWRALPAYALNRSPSVRYDARALPRLLPWLARFLAGATPARARATAVAMNGLLAGALDAHIELMDAAGARHRLRPTGYMKLFRTEPAFRRNAAERAVLTDFGIVHDVLDAPALRILEPHLAPAFSHAVLVRDSASVDDPAAVTAAYADWVRHQGGTLLRATVQAIDRTPDGYRLRTDAGDALDAETVVIAAGPWSGDLMAGLGLRVPLAAERGYHRRFGLIGNRRLGRPVHDVEGHYVMTCLGDAVQVSTGVELADRDAPSTGHQLARAETAARTAFSFGEPLGETWRGARPSLPDGRPMIGPVAGWPGLWCAFGHGHVGLSAGPVTGRLLAEAMTTGQVPDVLRPFAPDRYLGRAS